MFNNFSSEGEDISLETGFYYYIIDSLYLNDLKNGFNELNKNYLDKEIETKVFPYTEAPFAKFNNSKEIFNIRSIKKIKYDDLKSKERLDFTCDTGLIFFIKESRLEEFIKNYDYEDLVDSDIDIVDYEYLTEITNGMGERDIALVLAPGIGSGYDFEGGGLYRISR